MKDIKEMYEALNEGEVLVDNNNFTICKDLECADGPFVFRNPNGQTIDRASDVFDQPEKWKIQERQKTEIMTVKDLKEILKKYSDDLRIEIIKIGYHDCGFTYDWVWLKKDYVKHWSSCGASNIRIGLIE